MAARELGAAGVRPDYLKVEDVRAGAYEKRLQQEEKDGQDAELQDQPAAEGPEWPEPNILGTGAASSRISRLSLQQVRLKAWAV